MTGVCPSSCPASPWPLEPCAREMQGLCTKRPCQGSDPRQGSSGGAGSRDGSGFTPAAEDQAAQREAEAEGADGEAADRDRLAPRREPLPAAERVLLLGRERLSAALLAQRAAGAQAEVEVVEDLGRLVRHKPSV